MNTLLKIRKYDLVYFSTTQFPVCILGPYWKKRFRVPYVIDIQDPWHSEYYQDKPKEQRPQKYWFSYRLHKYLEPKAMKEVDGLITVSANYVKTLKERYAWLATVPSATITFGAFFPDFKIAKDNQDKFVPLLQKGFFNIVYVGRGGMDMGRAVAPLFQALKDGLEQEPALFGKLKFYFIGTSYAPAGRGNLTILPLARQLGVDSNVVEMPDRISYYHALLTLMNADALFIPGSDDPNYSASKIYPYLLTKKPLLAIFNAESNAANTIKACTADAALFTFTDRAAAPSYLLYKILSDWGKGIFKQIRLSESFKKYSAGHLVEEQVKLFNQAIHHFEGTHTDY